MNQLSYARVPSWSQDAIWYQIFPERFRNGCPASNPQLRDITDRDIDGWQVSPWGQRWYGQSEWEKKLGRFYTSVYFRRYGGDLVGVRDSLNYLQDLGVNAIYLNPIFTARSLHKYDGACFHHVDPTLGPDRAGDLRALERARETEDPSTWIWTAADEYFLELVADVHDRDMRIIIDGVFNHTGREFFAFQDILNHGKASRFRDWYTIDRWYKDGRIAYKGWAGHKSLPEFARSDEHLAKPVRDYVFAITERWMLPKGDLNQGIDGWRLDVAFCVPQQFWRDWHIHVRKLRADAYTTGEIVTLAKEYVQGDQFDAVMNYMWLYPTTSFFGGGVNAMSSKDFVRRQQALLDAYPRASSLAMQNLLDSHDVGRIVSMLANSDVPLDDWEAYFHASRAKSNKAFVTSKPDASSYDILRQIIVFQMTYIGAPMLYYGTEVGMWGGNDPDNRQPMMWRDIQYEDDQAGVARKVDASMLAFVKRAIRMRTESKALRRGDITWMDMEHDHVLAYERACEGERMVAIFNVSDAPHVARVEAPAHDVWTGDEVVAGEIPVPPHGWRILAY